MIYLDIVLNNIKKNKVKSIVAISICSVVLLLLSLYINNIHSSKVQLNDLSKTIPIYCRVTNLNGSLETGLEISEDLVVNIENSPYVKDCGFTVRMVAGLGDFPLDDWKEKLNLVVVGTNTVNAITGISVEGIHMNEKNEDFFSSNRPICIVGESTIEKYQLKIGDTIELNLFYQYYDEQKKLHYSKLKLLTVEITGIMNEITDYREQIPPDILLPFETVKDTFHQQGINFFADSAFFYVADPLKLNEFKKEMKKIGLLEKAPAADYSYQGNALAVRDSTFRALATQLRQSIDTLQGFFPFIFLTVAFIGYIVSFLIINSRQKEFALMRALGTSQTKCFLIFLLEQLFLILLGEILGGVIVILVFHKLLVAAFAGSIFLVSYLSGCIIALWRMGKTSVTEALFCNE
ncbi:ABC transporter permease [Konateibacter massiliensis]|uniref:ABC transporter permease n=1 Tax=Konateibacter massiliensis TaxID=2002841 RepID=UPI000C146FDD|nr:FtsX-like permease family protein [Konateibacter massiliensis]